MGFIYKITNDINDKLYIGLTFKEDPFDRWKKHLSDYKYMTKYSHRPLYQAMLEYGVDKFHFEIIEEQPDTEKLKEKQKYYIKLYNTFENGYNATIGGDGSVKEISKEEEEEIISLYEKGESISNLAVLFHHRSDIISNLLKKNNFTIESGAKKVLQIDKETGKILNYFNSFMEAANFLGKTGKGSHISEVCSGKRKSAYGYYWKTY